MADQSSRQYRQGALRIGDFRARVDLSRKESAAQIEEFVALHGVNSKVTEAQRSLDAALETFTEQFSVEPTLREFKEDLRHEHEATIWCKIHDVSYKLGDAKCRDEKIQKLEAKYTELLNSRAATLSSLDEALAFRALDDDAPTTLAQAQTAANKAYIAYSQKLAIQPDFDTDDYISFYDLTRDVDHQIAEAYRLADLEHVEDPV